MNKSLVISHIANADYPLWRQWLIKYHSWFDEILIYWDLSFRYPIFSAFIQQSLSHLPNITFLDPIEGTGDWRHKSTTRLIGHARGDWIFSIEQDWMVRDWDSLFKKMDSSMKTADMFGWWNPTENPYIHPAFFAIKRELLEKTSKDFSAHPEIPGSDHFAQITYDVQKHTGNIETYTGDVAPESQHFHLGGINMNYLNGLSPDYTFHRPDIFYVYNYFVRTADVDQDPRFIILSLEIEEKLKKLLPDSPHPVESPWKPFFV